MSPATRKPSAPVQLIVCDDHALFREGLAGLIDAQPDLSR